MYSFFFPVFKDDKRREVEVLRPLEDYVLPKIKTEFITADDIASLLAYMIDFNFMHDHDVLDGADALNNVTASALFHLSAKYLGISEDGQDSVEQVYNLINSFSYEPFKRPFFGYRPLDAYDNNYKQFCKEERTVYESESSDYFSIQKLCSGDLESSNGTIQLSPDCQWYCQAIVYNQEAQELVRSFYALAIDLEGPLVPDNPATLLPVCRFPGEGEPPLLKDGCWNRIVNDKGICFSSATGLLITSSDKYTWYETNRYEKTIWQRIVNVFTKSIAIYCRSLENVVALKVADVLELIVEVLKYIFSFSIS